MKTTSTVQLKIACSAAEVELIEKKAAELGESVTNLVRHALAVQYSLTLPDRAHGGARTPKEQPKPKSQA